MVQHVLSVHKVFGSIPSVPIKKRKYIYIYKPNYLPKTNKRANTITTITKTKTKKKSEVCPGVLMYTVKLARKQGRKLKRQTAGVKVYNVTLHQSCEEITAFCFKKEEGLRR